MADLIERLLNLEPGARQEAAAEIRRLTAENAKMLAAIYEAAGWSVTSIDEYKSEFGDDADPLDDAITEILYDRKQWAEACEAIRAGKDWPQTHYPSMVDRWTVAAQKQHIDTLTASLAAMERERDAWKAEAEAMRAFDAHFENSILPKNDDEWGAELHTLELAVAAARAKVNSLLQEAK